MTPTMKTVFFKANHEFSDVTWEDLKDPVKRRNLVQRPSVSTANLPGGPGERRDMRAHLEAMVHQILDGQVLAAEYAEDCC